MLARLVFDRRFRIAALAGVAAAGAAGAAAFLAPDATQLWRWVVAAALLLVAAAAALALKLAFASVIDNEHLRHGQARLTARMDGVGEAAESAAASARTFADDTRREAGQQLAAAQEEWGRQTADVRARLDAVRDEVSGVRAGAKELGAALKALRGEGFQPLVRTLSREGARAMQHEWPARLGIEVDERRLAYLAKKLIDTESRAVGRLAAPTDTAIMRALVASALGRRHVRVLEIGVLFGLNAAYLHEVASPRYETFHQTLVDPFFGYYGDDAPDPFTGVQVTEAVVRSNLARAGLPEGAYEIVVGLSTDEAVQRKVGDGGFDLVLIDGDHSYPAVVSDFEWAARVVVPGGYVVLDDYANPSWPDIERAVDDVVRQDPRFEEVGATAQTAVFRRRAG